MTIWFKYWSWFYPYLLCYKRNQPCHKSRGSPVFCTFLDNEILFSRILHNGLLFKLCELVIDNTKNWKIGIRKCFVSFVGGNSEIFSLHITGVLIADDTALISNLPRTLQESFFVVELYAYKWRRLHYNPNKSASFFFNKQSHISLKPWCKTLYQCSTKLQWRYLCWLCIAGLSFKW